MSLLKEVKALFGNPSAKGDLFEDYVLDMFPENVFGAIHVTPRSSDLNGRKVESQNEPDFQFRHKPTNHKFWVECKFRADLFQGKIAWSKPWQLAKYKEFQEAHRPEKMFVVIGFGGRSSRPEEMYCIPLDEVQYPALYPSTIAKYRRPTDKEFWYSGGKLF